MNRRIGIAIGRKAGSIVGLAHAGGKARIEFSASQARTAGISAAELLTSLLEKLPGNLRDGDVSIALSPGDLGCADVLEVPLTSESQIEAIAGSLAESHCAGFSAEELALDLQITPAEAGKTTIQIVTVPRVTLSSIQDAVKKSLPAGKLRLVTATVIALAKTLMPRRGTHLLAMSGEALIVRTNGDGAAKWRSFPINSNELSDRVMENAQCIREDSDIVLHAAGVNLSGMESVPVEFAAAAAVSLMHAPNAINLLRDAKDSPTGTMARLRGRLALAGAAAAMLLLSAGMYFNKQLKQAEAGDREFDRAEQRLWTSALPGVPFKSGALASQLKNILAQRNKTAEANKYPSALAFWSEMANVFPNANQIGMSVESLQLGPDGGRLIGRVNKGSPDALSNASILESALNNSNQLAAHGEFETKESEIVVRMRLDFRPPPAVQNAGLNVGNGPK